MIDRTYLPFQSAREYQDTGMQKWAGFFLSEHNSALTEDKNKRDFHSELSLEKKLLLLSQLYSQQLPCSLSVKEGNELRNYKGTIPAISKDYAVIKTNQGYYNFLLEDIVAIQLNEEVENESA